MFSKILLSHADTNVIVIIMTSYRSHMLCMCPKKKSYKMTSMTSWRRPEVACLLNKRLFLVCTRPGWCRRWCVRSCWFFFSILTRLELLLLYSSFRKRRLKTSMKWFCTNPVAMQQLQLNHRPSDYPIAISPADYFYTKHSPIMVNTELAWMLIFN